ncbi:MAG: hypothetical protein SGBAC_010195 [Bacillariaceae sp.]
MSTLNQADESGGKPASSNALVSMDSTGNKIFSATNNDVNSSFALLQQVQSILQENDVAKKIRIELENQVETFQKERDELNRQLDESRKTSEQTAQILQQQLSVKQEEWTKRYETEERNHKSSLQMLQSKLDDWEFQHQDWAVQQEKYQIDISTLENDKTRLESQMQQIESTLEAFKAEALRLQQDQTELSKAHQEKVVEMNIQLETIQNDQEAQRLQQKEERQSHVEQEENLQKTIDELRASVDEKETSLQSLNDKMKELRIEASHLKLDRHTQVGDMEATIANLEHENVAQSRQAEDYQAEIEKLQKEMDFLKSVFLEQQKQVEENENEKGQHNQEPKWQDLVQSLRIQVQAQTNIAETQSRELEVVKSQNMHLRVKLQVYSQQKEQLQRNWNETKEQLQNLQEGLSTPNDVIDEATQNATKTNSSLDDQRIQQDKEMRRLMEENNRLNDRIVQIEAQLVLTGSRGFDHSETKEDYNGHENGLGSSSQGETNDTIVQLQHRIMHLVEEKLILQTAVETLEHQFMESDLLERNATSRQLQEKKNQSPAMAIKMKEYWHNRQLQLQQQQDPPTIVVDENTKQADIIRQTMEHRKSQKLSRRISKKVLGTPIESKPVQTIDVKATEQLFLQEQQKQELLKKAQGERKKNLNNSPSKTTEIGRNNWVRSRDHGLVCSHDTTPSNSGVVELPEYLASKQHRFIQSAVQSSSTSSTNKKEKTTTWTRIRDSIAGPNTNKSGVERQPSDVDVDDFSLWVQELSQEQQRAETNDFEELSLNIPASMLDSTPVSSNAGRYAVQLIDDLLKVGADGAEELTKKLGKQEEAHATKTYRVVTPEQSKPIPASKEESQTASMGRGKAIDQSNLLGVYVNKQKEAANATTIGYLSSIFYGDPEEEEAKIQQKLLKRQLARKKKQEQEERVQLKKAVQGTIMSKPKTIFSSFV